MDNEMNKKIKYEFLIRSIGGNISVRVNDGELSYVAYWSEHGRYSHDIEKHPNWAHAEELLEIICDCDRENFINIIKLLNRNSNGYRIIKRIAKKQIANCESKISNIIAEAEFWKKIS